MVPLAPGRIFWAVYPGDRGDNKKRPMIVVTRRTDIIRTGEVFAVVCSTTFDEPIGPGEVRLPFAAEGRCVSKLSMDTVAVCDWTTTYSVEAIGEHDVGGLVPTHLLKEICVKAGLLFPSER